MNLFKTFEEYADREFIFVSPGGNQGDQMIYLGAYKLASEAGLNYRAIQYERGQNVHIFNKDIILYLQGGGGFNPWWNWTHWLLRKLREANPENHIIVGPTTVDTDRAFLSQVLDVDENTTFYARERTTHDVMKEYAADVRIDHDTALHLRLGDGHLHRLVGTLNLRNDFSLLALRGDIESGAVPNQVHEADFDRVVDPCITGEWAMLHMHAKRIVANRSHSAIMGAVLGKDTSLFAGSYHKNRSIWDYSLKDMGVKWLE